MTLCKYVAYFPKQMMSVGRAVRVSRGRAAGSLGFSLRAWAQGAAEALRAQDRLSGRFAGLHSCRLIRSGGRTTKEVLSVSHFADTGADLEWHIEQE
ncbi:hypothetical protein NDU88_006334 [Pleurodeles waltl]|uniref:Uncharacterized protein n=1 Tax=Pleurodeles waltl TaxID=8319 RepID=A0AAV7LSA6_PLEWA|nr:hypothetical protein NDU88_006334 [Pleurodeles waltl]